MGAGALAGRRLQSGVGRGDGAAVDGVRDGVPGEARPREDVARLGAEGGGGGRRREALVVEPEGAAEHGEGARLGVVAVDEEVVGGGLLVVDELGGEADAGDGDAGLAQASLPVVGRLGGEERLDLVAQLGIEGVALLLGEAGVEGGVVQSPPLP